MKNYLKKRLIPVILIKDGLVVQSIKFSEYKIIGKPITTISRLNKFGSDEIIILDISKNKVYQKFREEDNLSHNKNYLELINQISKVNFIPLSAGGGISNLNDIENMLKNGCDKVVLNTLCIEDINFISKASKIFGSQCLIGSIDYVNIKNKRFVVKKGSEITDLDPIIHAFNLANEGIGEVMFNSVDRDGLKDGYDTEYLEEVVKIIKLPIITCGGAGSWEHMSDVVQKTNCDAVGASNIFHHVEYSTYMAKKYLVDKKLNFRKPELFNS